MRVDNSAFEIGWHPDAILSQALRDELDAAVRQPNVGFYLRGEEFSLGLEGFLTACLRRDFHLDAALRAGKAPDLANGSEVEALIDPIAGKAGLK